MTKELQLIHLCDHTVQTDSVVNINVILTRNENFDYDIINESRNIVQITDVSMDLGDDRTLIYSQGFDYITYAHNKILWLSSADDKPNNGDLYSVNYDVIVTTQESPIQLDCPKCAGNGWYANIISSSSGVLGYVDGITKLCQMVIKALVTRRTSTGYGTTLVNDMKLPIYSNSDIEDRITTNIQYVEEFVKKTQADLISMGTDISDDERLESISIDDISYDNSLFEAYVTITINSYSDQTAQIGIKI